MAELKSITVVDVRGGYCCIKEGEGRGGALRRNSRRRFEHHVAALTVQDFYFYFFGQQFEWDFFRAVAAPGSVVKCFFPEFFVAVLLLY